MLINQAALISLFSATLRLAAPLLLTALGAVYCERSGVVNIGLEGIMTVGAFSALATTLVTHNPWLGVLAAILAGAILAALHAVVSIHFRANQVVSGVAINILAAGLTAFLLTVFYGHGGQSPAIKLAWQLPRWFEFLEGIPFFGPIIGGHTPGVYLAFLMVPVTYFVLYRTRLGLRIRAVGEHPRAADTVGVNVFNIRYFGVIMSGVLGGFAGSMMSIGTGTVFLEGMVAGRGFIALAAMIFGKWHPVGTMWACLLFGFAESLQLIIQVMGWTFVKPGVIATLPYVLTILALAGFVGRSTPPASSGVPYEKGGK